MESSAEVARVDDPQAIVPPPLTGLGGWLVLIGIGQILGCIRIFLTMLSTYTSKETYLAMQKLPAAMELEVLLNAALVGIVGFTTYAYFAKKRLFPIVFTIEAAASVFMIPLDDLLVSAATTATFQSLFDPQDAGHIGGAVITSLIWIPYVFLSKRVENTFVN